MRAFTLLLVLIGLPACTRQEAAASSPELQALLEQGRGRAGKAVWDSVTRFYAARDHRLAWSSDDGPNDRATAALATLRQAPDHGLEAKRYAEAELTKQHAALSADADDSPDRRRQLAAFDLRLTAALFELGRDVAVGRLAPSVIDARWNIRREPPDAVAALQSAMSSSLPAFLDAVRPRHPEYAALQRGLASLRGQAAQGWPPIPRARLTVGQWNQAVIPLRQRLAAGGYLDEPASDGSAQFDAAVAAALRAFQEHHGLDASGRLDGPTLTALNVPIDQRIAQVAMNLERWRWLPDDLGARHLMVNIPQFHVIAREAGEPVLDIRVVVGKRGNETPTFSDTMTHVVFSPYWNIPESIVMEETAPALARDPDYLARNNMEVVDKAGQVVSAAEIAWEDPSALQGLSFRQRPGAQNALGLVKFMFPNRYNVYLHDTPADALFSRIGRAFSHGCVRVEEPETLAQYVLRDQPRWTADAIRRAMHAGEEQHVKLKEPIPVHLVYFTSWVDERGGLNFRDDVYGYDARQARAAGR